MRIQQINNNIPSYRAKMSTISVPKNCIGKRLNDIADIFNLRAKDECHNAEFGIYYTEAVGATEKSFIFTLDGINKNQKMQICGNFLGDNCRAFLALNNMQIVSKFQKILHKATSPKVAKIFLENEEYNKDPSHSIDDKYDQMLATHNHVTKYIKNSLNDDVILNKHCCHWQ